MRPELIATWPMYGPSSRVQRAGERLLERVFDDLGVSRGTAPRALYRQWLHPRLLLSQTCGYPLMTRLGERVTLLARPDHVGTHAGAPATHCSLIIVRRDDPRTAVMDFAGARAVINGRGSNTGMNLFRHALARAGARGRFFAAIHLSGAHQASMAMVADGQADIAAVDEITWRYIERDEPARCAELRVLATTTASPTLPLITRRQTSAPMCREIVSALNHALVAEPDTAKVLGVRHFLPTNRAVYRPITDYESEAGRLGYPELA